MPLPISKPRLTIWLPATAILFFLSIYIPIASHILASAATQSVSADTSHHSFTTRATVPQHPTVPAAVPDCTPLTEQTPSPIDTSTSALGLRIQNDTPSFYQIYGTSAEQLRNQITHCAPHASGASTAEYTGETSYALSWQYNTATNGTSCIITDVRVAIRIATTLPYWQPSEAADPGLSSRWSQFTQALTTHEQGHAKLDATYATLLLQRLNGLGARDCETIKSTVVSTVNTTTQSLNAANDSYDQQTDHGATQGAVIPTY